MSNTESDILKEKIGDEIYCLVLDPLLRGYIGYKTDSKRQVATLSNLYENRPLVTYSRIEQEQHINNQRLLANLITMLEALGYTQLNFTEGFFRDFPECLQVIFKLATGSDDHNNPCVGDLKLQVPDIREILPDIEPL